MMIRDLIYLAGAGKRKNARKALAQRYTVGLCVATTAAAMGVVTGMLIAPKSGAETRAGIRRSAVKSVVATKNAILGKADAVKDFTEDAAQEATDTIQGSVKAKSAKKDA